LEESSLKRIFSFFVSAALLLTCFLGTAFAVSSAEPYASPIITYYDADMVCDGEGNARVDFSIASSRIADELGVEVIKVYKSNGDNVKTVNGSVQNGLIYEDDSWHSDSYNISLSSGSYYAKITLFATAGSISDSRTITTSTIKIP